MFETLFQRIFGCLHNNYSFPFTVKPSRRRPIKAAIPTGTYVVCLECGVEMPYSWKEMRIVDPNKKTKSITETETVLETR